MWHDIVSVLARMIEAPYIERPPVTLATPTLNNDDVRNADRSNVFHSWSAQGALKPFVIAGGLGCLVWDHDGREYLDFSSQLVNVNIGHQHPKVVAAIQEQAALLTTIAPAHANATRNEAARRVVERAPEGFNRVFFTNSTLR